MKYILVLCGIIITMQYCSSSTAQNIKLDWAYRNGSGPSDDAKASAVDYLGNIYIASIFWDSIWVGPLPQSSTKLYCQGYQSSYLAKYSPAGNLLWAKTMEIKGSLTVTDLAVDNTFGNIYFTGRFRDSVDFDPGSGIAWQSNPTIKQDGFVCKWDSNGNYIWVKQFVNAGGTAGGNCHPENIFVNANGSVVCTGNFTGTFDANPGLPSLQLVSAGSWDVFACVLLNDGSFVNAISFGGSQSDGVLSMDHDSLGNIYLAGQFIDTVDFDPSIAVYDMSSISIYGDIYVVKYNYLLGFDWAIQLGSAANGLDPQIVIDSQFRLLLFARFSSTMDFDPGPGVFYLSPIGNSYFILSLSLSGTFNWVKTISAIDGVTARIAVGKKHDILFFGVFKGTMDVDPSTSSYLLTAGALWTGFICQWDPLGAFLWAGLINNTNMNSASVIHPDNLEYPDTSSFFLFGQMKGSYDFDPGPGSNVISVPGVGNTYIAKFKSCVNSFAVINITDCQAVVSPSGNIIYTTSGVYIDTIINSQGCDSIITINCTISGPSTSVSSVANGAISNELNAHYQWLNCDSAYSILPADTLQSFFPGKSGNFAVELTKNNCVDTSICLFICVNTSSVDTIVSCNSSASPSGLFTWYTSGVYYDTIPNSHGCDSVITIHLTIERVDTSVSINIPSGQFSTVLISNDTNANYQWLDCGLGFAVIPGETNRVYQPNSNGSFAVKLTTASCIDTSGCYTIMDVSAPILGESSIKIYPNPSDGSIYLVSGEYYNNLRLAFIDVLGKEWFIGNMSIHEKTVLDLKLPTGMYIPRITLPDSKVILLSPILIRQ